jgi:hypothetical protein
MEVNYDFTEDNYWHCGVRHVVFNILGNVCCVYFFFYFLSNLYTHPSPAAIVKANKKLKFSLSTS